MTVEVAVGCPDYHARCCDDVSCGCEFDEALRTSVLISCECGAMDL